MKPIEAETCVDAWLQACDYLLTQEADDWRAYNIILEIANPLALPPEDYAVVMVIDRFLAERGGLPINTVVNTIFPAQLYLRHGAARLHERYMTEIYPQVKQHPDWQWGTYAERIFSRRDCNGTEIKPLHDLLAKLKGQLPLSGPNRAAYELGTVEPFLDLPIYDPARDRHRPIGGPCLSHVSVKLTKDQRVMLTGFYRSHFYVQRALGNLFGLAHLQHFIAKEAGIEAGPLICHSSMAQLELKPKKKNGPEHEKWGKSAVADLIARCHAARQLSAA
jgi:hypothetical protein